MPLYSIRQALLTCAAILYAAAFAVSQETASLSIHVTDAQDAAVSFARVSIYPQGVSSPLRGSTDARGAYRVALPSGGAVLIEVDAEGFRTHSRTVLIQPGANAHEDVSLEVAGVSTSIVVTASNAPETIDQTAKALTVVDSRAILDRNEYTLAGILKTVPGVQTLTTGGPGQLSTLRVRGLRGDATAILIDGMRFRDPASAQGDASAFVSNLNFIAADRVEVLRGSGSSLYGTNAAAGVVNIVTSEGGGAVHGSIRAEGGNSGFLRGSAQISGGAFQDRLKYTAGLLHLNVMRGADGNDRTRSSGGQGFLRYDLTPRAFVSARFFGSDDFVQLNTSPTSAGVPAANIPASVIVRADPLPIDQVQRLLNGETVNYGSATYVPATDDPDSRRASRFHSTAIKFQQVLSEDLSLQASYHTVHTLRVHTNGPAGVGFQPPVGTDSRYVGDVDTVDVRANLSVSQWSQWTGGYEFERESYRDLLDNNLPAAQRVRTQTSIQQKANAVFFQNQLSFLRNRLQISLSGRVQSFTLARPRSQATGVSGAYDRVPLKAPPKAVTGDLSLSYFARSSGTKLRAHFGNAYRAPALFERFGGGFFTNSATGQLGFTPYGDPSLSPDRYNSIDGGVDQYLWGDRVRVSATYFYTRVVTITAFDTGTVIHAATDPYGRTSGYINGSGGLSRGVEIGVEVNPTRNMTINGSYTYSRGNTDRDITVPGFWRVLGTSRHLFALLVAKQLGARASIAVDIAGSSEAFGRQTAAGSMRAFQYPGSVKTDVSASYVLKQADQGSVKLFTRIENILNRTHYDLGWLAPGTTFVAGLGVHF